MQCTDCGSRAGWADSLTASYDRTTDADDAEVDLVDADHDGTAVNCLACGWMVLTVVEGRMTVTIGALVRHTRCTPGGVAGACGTL